MSGSFSRTYGRKATKVYSGRGADIVMQSLALPPIQLGGYPVNQGQYLLLLRPRHLKTLLVFVSVSLWVTISLPTRLHCRLLECHLIRINQAGLNVCTPGVFVLPLLRDPTVYQTM